MFNVEHQECKAIQRCLQSEDIPYRMPMFFFYIDIRQKTHTHLADGLELFIFFIVTSQQEAPIGACPFSFPQIGPNHTQVHCVSNSLQVVLLQLGEDNSKREIHSCINHPMFWSLFNTGK